MSATLIDGKAAAEELRQRIATDVANRVDRGIPPPGLRVILVGDNPASRVYVNTKAKMAAACGIDAALIERPDSLSTEDLLAEIAALNADPSVHGILVQLPLPKQIDEAAVLMAIEPAKDVDGFHPLNVGRLFAHKRGVPTDLMLPCTPAGCLQLIRQVTEPAGKTAVVLGRSNIVGKPMAALLTLADASPMIVHSKTPDPAHFVKQADIVVAAVGQAQLVKADWIKPGAVVIDVGMNRIDGPDGKSRLCGDVDFDAAKHVAGAITPVPGGVGPMTVANLLANTALSARIAQENA